MCTYTYYNKSEKLRAAAYNHPTMSRVAFELRSLSKMFECCFDWILRLSVEEERMLVIKELYKFDVGKPKSRMKSAGGY